MNDLREEQTRQILTSLRRHPRILFQKLLLAEEQTEQLKVTLPLLVPFPGSSYHGFLPVLDWDHRLPSRVAILRIYAYYTESSFCSGLESYEQRSALIGKRDVFPEFDVPDYSGLMADESYEIIVDKSGKVTQVQLLSDWRRNVEAKQALAAVQVVRKSEEYRKASFRPDRPDFLGDLEARRWTPPCEGSCKSWTIDVWYLTDYNGVVGKGLSFLVDLDEKKVVSIREFVIRAA